MNQRMSPKNVLALIPYVLELVKNATLLVVAFLGAYSLAPLFRAPFENPYNISNPLNGSGFNPNNNFYGIAFIIVTTLIGYCLLNWLYERKRNWILKLILLGLVLTNFFLVNCLTSPGYATGVQGLDNFHAGEQLAPTGAFMSGTNLYSDMFYLRGAGVDAVLPALGFHIFGKSIGSFLLVSDLFMLLAIAAFGILLACLIRRPFVYGLALFLFYLSDALSLVHVRDISTWLVIGLLLLLFKHGLSHKARPYILSAIGFICFLTLYISVDRGVMLAMLAIALIISLTLISSSDDNTYKIIPKRWLINSQQSLWVMAGALLGLGMPALLLGWNGFTSFIAMTFVDIPRFGGLLVSQPFPGLFGPTYLFWAPIFISILIALLLFRLWRFSSKRDLNILVPYTLIFGFSVLCLKIGANRIALSKLASVTAPLYLITVLIIVYALHLYLHDKKVRIQLFFPLLAAVGLLVLFAQPNWQKLKQPEYTRAQLAQYKNLPHTPDDMWLTPETAQVRNHILEHTAPNESIFAFTSDPVYYYLTGRPNPTRFYVSWFADPQPYTNQVLTDLKAAPPKLIVYKEGSWMDAPDTVPMEDRIPEVNAWITSQYSNKVQIGNTTLLTK